MISRVPASSPISDATTGRRALIPETNLKEPDRSSEANPEELVFTFRMAPLFS